VSYETKHSSLRVLYVCDNLLPPFHLTSGMKAIFQTCLSLKNKGAEIDILTAIEKGTSPDWQTWARELTESTGIRVFVIKPWLGGGILDFLALRLRYLTHALRLQKSFRYDIIHEHSSSPLIANRGGLIRLFSDAKIVHSLCTVNKSFLGKMKWLFLRPHLLITPSAREYPLPVEEEVFREPIFPDSKTFLYFGLLNSEKGIETFLEAVPKVLDRVGDSNCLIVAPPREQISSTEEGFHEKIRELSKAYSGRVRFTRETVSVAQLFSSVEVVTYPLTTLHGTLRNPSILIEAMATARGIVVSALPELDDLIEPEKNALAFPPSNAEALSAQVIRLLEDRDLCRQLGKAARQSAEPFRLKNVSRQLFESYERLLHGKKIAFLTDIPEETGSWVGRYEPWAKYLRKRGHEVRVFMPSLGKAKTGEISTTGPALFRKTAQGRSHYSTLSLIAISLENLFHAIRHLVCYHPEVIIVGKPLPIASTAAVLYRLVFKSLLIVDCDDLETETNSFSSQFQRQIVAFFERFLPRCATMVTTHTQSNRARLVESGVDPQKIVFLVNGVDPDRFSRVALSPQETRPIVLYLGDLNLSTGHAVDLLLESFAKVLPHCKEALLHIVGDGQDERKLSDISKKLGIEDSVKWFGRVRPDEVASFIQSCRVMVDPVRDELANRFRCPLKLIEGVHCRKIVVTSDVGDRKFLLEGQGILVAPNDSNALARGILEGLQGGSLPLKENTPSYDRFLWPNLVEVFERTCLTREPV
jgi:glycosyltransferase involved in cell wall biosynthesis